MWNGFIGQRIAATNKTLRYAGMVLFAAAAIVCAIGARTFINAQEGPAKIGEEQLARLGNPDFQMRNFVMVEGEGTEPTGLTAIEETTRNGVKESEKTTGEYMATLVGKHILIVKAKPGEVAQTYKGTLTALPTDLKKELFADMQEPEMQDATLPVLLDATVEYGEDLIVGYVVVGVLLAFGMWAFLLAKRRSESPERHPLCKRLLQYGPLYTVVPEIDADMAGGTSKLGNATFSPRWVIYSYGLQLSVMKRDEIVWIYKKRTKHSVNFIPTGTTYALILRDSRAGLLEVTAKQPSVDSYLASFANQTPWVIFGYDPKVEKFYKKELQAFVRKVSDRKVSAKVAS
jgi:hypothetical protein